MLTFQNLFMLLLMYYVLKLYLDFGANIKNRVVSVGSSSCPQMRQLWKHMLPFIFHILFKQYAVLVTDILIFTLWLFTFKNLLLTFALSFTSLLTITTISNKKFYWVHFSQVFSWLLLSRSVSISSLFVKCEVGIVFYAPVYVIMHFNNKSLWCFNNIQMWCL